jgi:hypothetical protein
MSQNKRVFYAVQQIGFAKVGTNTFTSAYGVQSIGVNTKFNLEQVFEMGQISLYANVENIPDVEVTAQKVLDGKALLYHLATNGSTSPSLSGRSNVKTTVGLSLYSDSQDAASGTPLSQCTMSGMFVSSLSFDFNTTGQSTESVSLVGNNKVYSNTFTATAFTNADAPTQLTRRENILFGEASTSGVCRLPQDIPGISSSGYNPYSAVTQTFGSHIQSIKVSTNLGRDQLFELGKRGPYHRYVTFPIEVKTDIETIAQEGGDGVSALEENTANLTNRTIVIRATDGLVVDLGTKNKLASVTYGGANAGTNGGNASVTYSYTNFNDCIVTHPQDPSGL